MTTKPEVFVVPLPVPKPDTLNVYGTGVTPVRFVQDTQVIRLADHEAERAADADLIERLKQETKIHAQEARTANNVIAEIYQLVTGSTGEPGNWNGAEPVRKRLDADTARIAELEAALAPFAHAADRFMPRNRKLADARRDQATIWSACDGKYAITVQDLRTADAALAAYRKGGEV